MRVVRLPFLFQAKLARELARFLECGEVLVVPTDTVYGLIANAQDKGAVEKIFQIKSRPEERALPIFVKDIVTARQYAVVPQRIEPFLREVWPGPVTVILEKKPGALPDILTSGFPTLGIRIPQHRFLLKLLSALTFPLSQTSANISGETASRTCNEALRFFQNRTPAPYLYIDGGAVSGTASSIIDCTSSHPRIAREGAVSRAHLESLLRKHGLL